MKKSSREGFNRLRHDDKKCNEKNLRLTSEKRPKNLNYKYVIQWYRAN